MNSVGLNKQIQVPFVSDICSLLQSKHAGFLLTVFELNIDSWYSSRVPEITEPLFGNTVQI